MMENTITPHAGTERHPNIPADLQASDGFLKRIRTLRWIGMEAEARELELASQVAVPIGPVLTGRFDTD